MASKNQFEFEKILSANGWEDTSKEVHPEIQKIISKFRELQGDEELENKDDELSEIDKSIVSLFHEYYNIEEYDEEEARELEELRKKEAERKAKEAEAAAAEQEKNEKFKELVSQADRALANQEWVNARGLYQESLGLKPDEKYPAGKIKEINDYLEQSRTDDQKKRAIAEAKEICAKADQLFHDGDLTGSIKVYKDALKISPDMEYAEKQIDKATEILKQKEEEAKAKARQEEEARKKAEAEAKARQEEEAKAKKAAEEEAKLSHNDKVINAIYTKVKNGEIKPEQVTTRYLMDLGYQGSLTVSRYFKTENFTLQRPRYSNDWTITPITNDQKKADAKKKPESKKDKQLEGQDNKKPTLKTPEKKNENPAGEGGGSSEEKPSEEKEDAPQKGNPDNSGNSKTELNEESPEGSSEGKGKESAENQVEA